VSNLNNKKFLFWDFDGVIKDSVEVKTHAFRRLFESIDLNLVDQIVEHHKKNTGISRFEKIPIYLDWIGIYFDKATVQKYISDFSDLVVEDVIESPWVPGVIEYLENNKVDKFFFLVTATPKEEIDLILKKLSINDIFTEVVGAPINKTSAIESIIREYNIVKKDACMIGDSESDMEAAVHNKIDFFLRKTALNRPLQDLYKGPQFENFIDE